LSTLFAALVIELGDFPDPLERYGLREGLSVDELVRYNDEGVAYIGR
jgi:hypothetical protein